MIQYTYSADDIGRLFLLPAYAGVFFTKRIKNEQIIKQYTNPYAQRRIFKQQQSQPR